jgi:hypothetical protein
MYLSEFCAWISPTKQAIPNYLKVKEMPLKSAELLLNKGAFIY